MRALITVFWIFLATSAFAAMPPQTGEKAPDWILSTAEGKRISLYDDSEGKKVVMLFWATWCPFCHELMPDLEALRKEFEEQDVKFYALNVWDDGDPRGFMSRKDYGMKLLLQADTVAQRYGVVGTPGLFVIDEEKNITYIRHKGTSKDAAIASVKEALTF
ncbi:peroxiredoxin family protein [Sessilibacter corallicola]|uniref:Redoxin domain-containing protein n=1 Tax=Sessilibacter corallicola TaxID=2904075 RepID=A0ABQ0A8V3_9GAMM